MKKIIVLLAVAVFGDGITSLAFGETVTKIVGSRITVMDDTGKEKTI